MKNYYEILEVDKKASKEIIDKAYRTLVKKYHPDLKEHYEKNAAEDKIKEINEAYDVLSDKEKKEEYDRTIQSNYISIEEYNLLIKENKELKIKINNLENNILNKLNHNNNTTNVNTSNSNNYYKSTQNNKSNYNNYNNYGKNAYTNSYSNYSYKNQYNNYSNTTYKNTILSSLFLVLKNILIFISRYFFIFFIILTIFILLRKHFFYTIFDFFDFKDILIIAGILFFIIYKFKQE